MNLDALGFDDLELLRAGMECHPIQHARTLFPERPKGYVRTAKLMALYACELLEARRYRAQGHIADALKVEERCQAIYERLPEYARW
jgi:hypothetical protein